MRLIPLFRSIFVILGSLCVLIVATLLFWRTLPNGWQHFTDQSRGFLEGRLYSTLFTHDLVEHNGKHYWPNGPFPAVVMMPFLALFGDGIQQGHVQAVLITCLGLLAYHLARQKGYSKEHSIFLTGAFFFASVAYPLLVNSKSWFFSQVVAMVFGMLALYLYETKRSYLWIGLSLCGVFATRPTAGIMVLPLALQIFVSAGPLRAKVRNAVLFLLPLIWCLAALLWFNWARFGNPFDNGYTTNNIGGISEPLREIGVFSLAHIPMNLYWYFLGPLEPVTGASAHLVFPYVTYSVWGLSLLIVSPFFFVSLRALGQRSLWVRSLWWACGITMIFLLTYFNTGWYTYGPRYFADMLPLIYLLTLYALHKKVSVQLQLLIVASALLNSYLLFTTPLS